MSLSGRPPDGAADAARGTLSREASGGENRPSEAFPRQRRLKRRRLIRPLFDRRRRDVHSLAVGVIRLKWRLVSREATGQRGPVQVGFAPGRRARTNAGRTTLRRHLRETFRRHQADLLLAMEARPEDALTLMLLFRGREDTASADLRRDLPLALARLADRLAPEASGADRTSDADAP